MLTEIERITAAHMNGIPNATDSKFEEIHGTRPSLPSYLEAWEIYYVNE